MSKPFTSRHCTPINYGSPLEQKGFTKTLTKKKLEKVKKDSNNKVAFGTTLDGQEVNLGRITSTEIRNKNK